MDVTDDGRDTSSSAVSPLQAEPGTLASPSAKEAFLTELPPSAPPQPSLAEPRPAGKEISVTPVAPSRMRPPIVSTPSGSERDASAVQPLKAWSPMDLTPSGREMDASAVQPLKARPPMDVTTQPSMVAGIATEVSDPSYPVMVIVPSLFFEYLMSLRCPSSATARASTEELCVVDSSSDASFDSDAVSPSAASGASASVCSASSSLSEASDLDAA